MRQKSNEEKGNPLRTFYWSVVKFDSVVAGQFSPAARIANEKCCNKKHRGYFESYQFAGIKTRYDKKV